MFYAPLRIVSGLLLALLRESLHVHTKFHHPKALDNASVQEQKPVEQVLATYIKASLQSVRFGYYVTKFHLS